MKYDFTTVMNRTGQDALAVDIPLDGSPNNYFPGTKLRDGFDKIPMWVADMNFPTVPTVPEAIIKRAQHPAYGYYRPREEYYDSIIRWQAERNGVVGLYPEHIGYENGVLGGVVSALNVLTAPGDPVLLNSPAYIGFTHSLEDNGRRIVLSPLKQDDQGIWRMDLEDMEHRIKKEHIHTAIFCSPHNPSGRVWERREIEQVMELFRKYNVYVISDEIWSDLTLDGHRHTPTQSVSEDAKMRTVAIYAPSKTFNLAGLIGSYRIVYNPWLSDRITAEASRNHYNSMNVLSMHALIQLLSEAGLKPYAMLNMVTQYMESHPKEKALLESIGAFEQVTIANDFRVQSYIITCDKKETDDRQ